MSEKGHKFTEAEMRAITSALLSLKTPPTIDYARMCAVGGYKSIASAQTIWCSVKKKFPAVAGVEGATPNSKKAGGDSSAGKGKGKKRIAAAADEDDDEALGVGKVKKAKTEMTEEGGLKAEDIDFFA